MDTESSELIKGVKQFDLRTVTSCSADLIKKTEKQGTSLLCLCMSPKVAVQLGTRQQMALELISKGANLNGTHGSSPLHYCIESNLDKLAELLIKLGANVCQSISGKTALACAVEKQKIPLINLLLEHGANVTLASALTKAVAVGHEELIRQCYNNIIIINSKANNSTENAPNSNKPNLVKFILQKIEEAKCPSSQMMKNIALFKAIELGNLQIIQTLIEAGADLNFKDDCGSTAISTAVNSQNILISDFVFTQKQYTAKNKHINNPLILQALSNHDLCTVRRLVSVPSISLAPIMKKIEQMAKIDEDVAILLSDLDLHRKMEKSLKRSYFDKDWSDED